MIQKVSGLLACTEERIFATLTAWFLSMYLIVCVFDIYLLLILLVRLSYFCLFTKMISFRHTSHRLQIFHLLFFVLPWHSKGKHPTFLPPYSSSNVLFIRLWVPRCSSVSRALTILGCWFYSVIPSTLSFFLIL